MTTGRTIIRSTGCTTLDTPVRQRERAFPVETSRSCSRSSLFGYGRSSGNAPFAWPDAASRAPRSTLTGQEVSTLSSAPRPAGVARDAASSRSRCPYSDGRPSSVECRDMQTHFPSCANDLACQGYNIRALIDRAGALVERVAYDPYGRPLIRESVGRGDMDDDTDMDSPDSGRLSSAISGSIWDPRGDIDDDGDVDLTDRTLYMSKDNNWPPQSSSTVVAQAFSDVGNPFMFQGRPHFALDTAASDTEGKLMLNDHRARFNDPITGRWVTRDPLGYNSFLLSVLSPGDILSWQAILRGMTQSHENTHGQIMMFRFLSSNPVIWFDGSGLCGEICADFLDPNPPPGQPNRSVGTTCFNIDNETCATPNATTTTTITSDGNSTTAAFLEQLCDNLNSTGGTVRGCATSGTPPNVTVVITMEVEAICGSGGSFDGGITITFGDNPEGEQTLSITWQCHICDDSCECDCLDIAQI